eukprot:543462-Heterocapsa_arctica.AAC.1
MGSLGIAGPKWVPGVDPIQRVGDIHLPVKTRDLYRLPSRSRRAGSRERTEVEIGLPSPLSRSDNGMEEHFPRIVFGRRVNTPGPFSAARGSCRGLCGRGGVGVAPVGCVRLWKSANPREVRVRFAQERAVRGPRPRPISRGVLPVAPADVGRVAASTKP